MLTANPTGGWPVHRDTGYRVARCPRSIDNGVSEVRRFAD